MSFRRIERFVDVSQVAVHNWYHPLEPDRDRRQAVAVDKTKIAIEDEEVYVLTAVDVDTFGVLYVEASPGRSSLDALLFLMEVLKYCRDQPAPPADRGDWYDWPLDLLDCKAYQKTWGDRSLIEALFSVLTYRTNLFRHRFPQYSIREPTESWLTAFATLHNAVLQSYTPIALSRIF